MEKVFCTKCGFPNPESIKFNQLLCDFCYSFSPNEEKDFLNYVGEKVDFRLIESFRKNFNSRGIQQKKGMLKKYSEGEVMSRAPFGYKLEKKVLVPAQNFREIEEIFEEFLNSEISLNQLSQKHNLSVNGIKKILRNFTYLGKIKFNNQIRDGNHVPIISSTLFNHVQNKLEKLGIK